MEKDFDGWNNKKKEIDTASVEHLYFREGDIWWCSLGLNVGTESNGKGDQFRRPVLVYKKLSNDFFIGLPLSTKSKSGTWFQTISFLGENRTVLLYQIKAISKNRFQRKIGEIDEMDFTQVKEKLEILLKPSFLNHHPAEAGIDGKSPKVN